jgi:hypothetical protein
MESVGKAVHFLLLSAVRTGKLTTQLTKIVRTEEGKYHQWQLVDGSDPFYKQLTDQSSARRERT